eukprot:1294988-Pleurochrysis_carterae.AAC.2
MRERQYGGSCGALPSRDFACSGGNGFDGGGGGGSGPFGSFSGGHEGSARGDGNGDGRGLQSLEGDFDADSHQVSAG